MATNDPTVDIDELVIQSYHNSQIGTRSIQLLSDQFEISPNPNHGQFVIQFDADKAEAYTASVTDLMGHTIIHQKKDAIEGMNKWEFSATHLLDGVYIMQLSTDKEISTVKFVVE